MSNTTKNAPSKEDVNAELSAMRAIVRALEGLDKAAQVRALTWVVDKFDYPIVDNAEPLAYQLANPTTIPADHRD